MTDKRCAYPMRMQQARLEWKQTQHMIDTLMNFVDSLGSPSPDGRTDKLHRRNTPRLECGRQVQIEVGRIHTDEHRRGILDQAVSQLPSDTHNFTVMPQHLCIATYRQLMVRPPGLKALLGTITLARAMKPHWKGQRYVGLLLPPSVPGALLNVAAALTGKTSVNLNYTVGRVGLESAVTQAGLKTVLTSRLFIEKAKLEIPGGVTVLYLEDIAKTISGGARRSISVSNSTMRFAAPRPVK